MEQTSTECGSHLLTILGINKQMTQHRELYQEAEIQIQGWRGPKFELCMESLLKCI